MREGFEARTQGLEAEVQSLVTALQEVKAQSLDEQRRMREAERLLSIRRSEWREAYEEVKRQMDLLDKAYEEIREWGTWRTRTKPCRKPLKKTKASCWSSKGSQTNIGKNF